MTTKSKRVWAFTLAMVGAWTVAAFVGGQMVEPDPSQFTPIGPGGTMPSDDLGSLVARALVAGTTSGLIAAFLELKVLPRLARRFGTGLLLAGRTILYALVGLVSVASTVRFMARQEFGITPLELWSSAGFQEFLQSPNFRALILTFVVASFIISGGLQVARLIGPGALAQILLGRYVRPRHEHRSFLFIDLVDSTAIAERLGPLRFAEFKNEFFHDMAEPVLDSRGQIVQYVGDEVLITWPVGRRGRDVAADGVRCFFDLHRRISERAAIYEERYGVVPSFRAGFHAGPVVVSQLGDIKREIAFSGDAVNTASRIQGLCKELGQTFIASTPFVTADSVPDGVSVQALGSRSLRGREATVELVALGRS